MEQGRDHSADRARDERYMRIALAMARRGFGATMPNPSVGAVILDDNDVILARGWTQPGGRPHAERVALEKAGAAARGATLYVTLEPCSHHGKSPPCADAVIEAGIRRVAVGVGDPFEQVAGQGIERLRAAGIEVVEHVLEPEAHWLTLGHILRVREQRPFVQLKIAVSKDGLIAPGDGQPVWVTGPEARARGHLLRAEADAIIIGSGTLRADDPALTCRLPGLEGRSPIRVLIDKDLGLAPDCGMLRQTPLDAPVWVAHASPQKAGAIEGLSARGVDLISLQPDADGRIAIKGLLAALAERGVTRLLVEGGPGLWRAFIEAGLVDEIVLFQGAGELGASGLRPFKIDGLEFIERADRFEEVDRRAVGGDKMTVYRNIKSMKVG